MSPFFVNHMHAWFSVILMMTGFFGLMVSGHLIKKLLSLALFQTSALLLYIAGGYVTGGSVPLVTEGVAQYVNPIPHVLMLTAIVVGVATMAVGLALAVRIRQEYGTASETAILAVEDGDSISPKKRISVTSKKSKKSKR